MNYSGVFQPISLVLYYEIPCASQNREAATYEHPIDIRASSDIHQFTSKLHLKTFYTFNCKPQTERPPRWSPELTL